jgi:hypothetical protein
MVEEFAADVCILTLHNLSYSGLTAEVNRRTVYI